MTDDNQRPLTEAEIADCSRAGWRHVERMRDPMPGQAWRDLTIKAMAELIADARVALCGGVPDGWEESDERHAFCAGVLARAAAIRAQEPERPMLGEWRSWGGFPRAPIDTEEREATRADRVKFCLVQHGEYGCSRGPLHDGDHVAGTWRGLVLARWPAAPAPPLIHYLTPSLTTPCGAGGPGSRALVAYSWEGVTCPECLSRRYVNEVGGFDERQVVPIAPHPPREAASAPTACPKCGGVDLWMAWTKAGASMFHRGFSERCTDTSEHFCRGCRTCWYMWTTPVAPPPPEAPITATPSVREDKPMAEPWDEHHQRRVKRWRKESRTHDVTHVAFAHEDGKWLVFDNRRSAPDCLVGQGIAPNQDSAKIDADAWIRANPHELDWGLRAENCRGCGKPLDYSEQRIADGCPCNARRGVNHGLVARHVCTCQECDPEQTGSVRMAPEAPTPAKPDLLDEDDRALVEHLRRRWLDGPLAEEGDNALLAIIDRLAPPVKGV